MIWKFKVALSIAIGFTIYCSAKEFYPDSEIVNHNQEFWFGYYGPNSPAGRADEKNYEIFIPQPTSRSFLCPDNEILCAIKRPINIFSNHPEPFTEVFRTAIEFSIYSHVESDSIELCSKD